MTGDRVTEINGEAFVRDLDSLIAERNALRNELGQWREAALKCTAAEGAMEAELEGARAKLAAVEKLTDELAADIPEDAGNATAHLAAERLRAALHPNQEGQGND